MKRRRIRWALAGIIALFILATAWNFIGFANPVARALDASLSAIPGINRLPVWPVVTQNPIDNSRNMDWQNIREIDLTTYGQPFRLGLDVLGGAHLVYQADMSAIAGSDQPEAIAGVRDVIERRINALGVSEPLVQTNRVGDAWRVVIELAGVYDINQAIKMIGETPLLEFKTEGAQSPLTAEQERQLNDRNAAIKQEAQALLDRAKRGDDFATLVRENTDDAGSKDNDGLYTAVKLGMFTAAFEDVAFNKAKVGEVYPELVQTEYGYHIIKKEAERGQGEAREIDVRHILLGFATPADVGAAVEPEWLSSPLTGKNLQRAVVEVDPTTGVPVVTLEFDSEGSKLFGQLTEQNVGKLIAIFLDGQPISMPQVNEPILAGRAQITGNFTITEAKDLARRLNAGALPVPITLVSQTTIGASLGNAAMEQSLWAGLWGFVAILLFMTVYYRLPGLIAGVALIIYISLALFVFKLLGITMTLAGVAGFILSIGMAVDANVLIFERLKEELRRGRDLSFAMSEGFARAWSSIRDSNVSSLLTCLILFWFGTSIIRGFALTLAIGIIVSMFSAITITRTLLMLVSGWRIARNRQLYARITTTK